jgi:hypothetical protein
MIKRSESRQRFTVVNNELVEDSRLSWKARGLLIFILSKPDNWQVSERHLATCSSEGVTAVRAGLKELEDSGYLKRERYRAEDGRWEWCSVIYESPCSGFPSMEKPRTGQPSTGQPSTGQPSTGQPSMENLSNITKTERTNTERIKTEEIKTQKQSPSALAQPTADRAVDGFDFEVWFETIFWPQYPRKMGKDGAKKGLLRIVKSAAKSAEVLVGLTRWLASHDWAKEGGKFIPYGSTWVNGRRWLDEPESQADAEKRMVGERKGTRPDVDELPRENPVVAAPKPLRPIPPDWFPGFNEYDARSYLRRAHEHLLAKLKRKPTEAELLPEARRIWRAGSPSAPLAPWEEGYVSPEEEVPLILLPTESPSGAFSSAYSN